MGIYSRSRKSFKYRGVRRTSYIICDKVRDRLFDILNGTDTFSNTLIKNLCITSNNKDRGVNYERTYTRPFKKLLNALQLPKDLVFVDVGSGKGKVLLLAARYGFIKNIGLEFSEALCEVAQKNVKTWKKGKFQNNIEIINTDVLDYCFKGDENIFYFFNPFDVVILNTLVDNILRSLSENFRPVRLIFHNMICHEQIIEKAGVFKQCGKYVFGSGEFTIYENMDSATS